MQDTPLNIVHGRDLSFIREVEAESGQKVSNCYQCGNCSAGCPAAFTYDLQTNQIMRAVQLGLKDKVLNSKSIWMCLSCSTCSLRCPNNIDVANVMETLRHMARRENRVNVPVMNKFWLSFLNTVRAFGRSFEIGTMRWIVAEGATESNITVAPTQMLADLLTIEEQLGRLAGVPVVCMQGRLHLYEGHSARDVALPVRVMRGLGAEILLATNAAGGINTGFSVGDLMLIEDHINFTGQNPLVGPNDGTLGPRFPDMSYAYDPALRALAERCAAACGIRLCKGIYLACQGPSYETPAEIRAFRTLGADAVGMSTVPEVIAANHCGMRVLAFSLISNMAAGVLPQKLTEEEVLEAGRQNGARLERLVTAILQNL